MTTPFVLSRSAAFDQHLAAVLPDIDRPRVFRSTRDVPQGATKERQILLLHAPSFAAELTELLPRLAERSGLSRGIAADAPQLKEMLSLSAHGIRAYFNSYMADTHYQHMLRLLAAGQTWFAPDLLTRALELARRSVDSGAGEELLGQLTPRQREIALAVAQGMSNKKIATAFDITERTVKTHLTQIFHTLELTDRVTLAIKLSGRPRQVIEEG